MKAGREEFERKVELIESVGEIKAKEDNLMEIDDEDLRMFEEMAKKNDTKVKEQVKKEEVVEL